MMKQKHPVEYAFRGLSNKAALSLWVADTLWKPYIMASSIQARVLKATYKYGVQISCSIEEVIAIDMENGNTL